MKYDLNGKWLLNSNRFKDISINIPGSVLSCLIDNNLIADPFVSKNELLTIPYLKEDYSFKREFNISKDDLLNNNYLCMDSIDTIADIFINDIFVVSTKDMHISYKILLDNRILKEHNTILIKFKSAYNYVDKIDTKKLFYSWGETMKYSPILRKANYMFGWDWGPNLPDIGINRDIYIYSSNLGYLDNFRHFEIFNDDGSVDINLEIDFNKLSSGKCHIELSNDESLYKEETILENKVKCSFHIEKPKLWNPVGYGEANLYKLLFKFYNDLESIEYNYKIGLRKVFIDDSKDKYGLQFKLYVNDNPIFIKGSDFIPQDNILSRVNYNNTYELLKLAKDFNHNTIRVWGGGYYLDDYFYDICDELGLLVFQDYMFACGLYDTKDLDFMSLVKEESINVIKRIRHHASIFMMCGNNENEVAITSWMPYRRIEAKKSFKDLYLGLLKNITKEYSDFYYLESSPTSREPYFVRPNDYNNLDMHFWDVWHGYKPFSAYKKIYPRLLSEFGCQSFPLYETVKTYAKDDELDIFHPVMMHHQKNRTCNNKILGYTRSMYKRPKDFRSLVYLSQLTQAEGIKTCVEHLRSNRGRCDGVLYWQLNDCWPGQSWSSLDYYLRPKALHYYSKKFYKKILAITDIKGKYLQIKISNDDILDHNYHLYVEHKDIDKNILNKFDVTGKLNKNTYTTALKEINPFIDKTKEYLKVTLYIDDNLYDTTYYHPRYPKFMKLYNADVKINKINDLEYSITTNTYTLGIAIEYKDKDIILSDNYFDLDDSLTKIIKSNKPLNLNEIFLTDISKVGKL